MKTATITRLALAGLATAVTTMAACSGDPDVEEFAPAPPIEQSEVPAPARDTTRMTVLQLARSVPAIAGQDAEGDDITWVYDDGQNEYPLFLFLGPTLGTPDYLAVTDEPAVPNGLYVKMMGDMAYSVCFQMAVADAQTTDQTARNLVRFAPLDDASDDAAISQNLRYLHLRFLGERVADDDTASIAGLRQVFDASVAEAKGGTTTTTNGVLEGWFATCIALLRSPAFHIY